VGHNRLNASPRVRKSPLAILFVIPRPKTPCNRFRVANQLDTVAPHVGGHGNVIQPIRGRGEMVEEPIIWCLLSNAFCDPLRRYHPLTLGPFPLSNQTVTRALRHGSVAVTALLRTPGTPTYLRLEVAVASGPRHA
jgi:hypothetical protein